MYLLMFLIPTQTSVKIKFHSILIRISFETKGLIGEKSRRMMYRRMIRKGEEQLNEEDQFPSPPLLLPLYPLFPRCTEGGNNLMEYDETRTTFRCTTSQLRDIIRVRSRIKSFFPSAFLGPRRTEEALLL